LQEAPRLQQFLAMDFGPRFDKTLLGLRQPAPDALDGIKGKHGLGFLIHRMKVRPVMGRTYFHEHSNDDSEEARELWHVVNSTSSKLDPDWLTLDFSRDGSSSQQPSSAANLC